MDELVHRQTSSATGRASENLARHMLTSRVGGALAAGVEGDSHRDTSMGREGSSGHTIAVRVPIADQWLDGDLGAPSQPQGVVLFAHGSGSSRHSRGISLSRELWRAAGSLLLIDLLTPAEETIDIRTAEYRFDLEMLAGRLAADRRLAAAPEGNRVASDRAVRREYRSGAALMALPRARRRLPRWFRAEDGRIWRGGTGEGHGADAPDRWRLGYAGDSDEPRCDEQMRGDVALEIVPGATHLFEESGTLERVADLAGAWFERI